MKSALHPRTVTLSLAVLLTFVMATPVALAQIDESCEVPDDLTISNGGNLMVTEGWLGIGVPAPLAPIHVRADSVGAIDAILLENATGPARISLWNLAQLDTDTTNKAWTINSNGDLRFTAGTDAAEMRLNAAGNLSIEGFLGIGASAPEYRLHLRGEGAQNVLFEDVAGTGARWFAGLAGNDTFKISADGTGMVEARFHRDGRLDLAGTLVVGGDLGVGADSPSDRLHIKDGNLRVEQSVAGTGAKINFVTAASMWELKQHGTTGRLTFFSPGGGAATGPFKIDRAATENLLRLGVAGPDVVDTSGSMEVRRNLFVGQDSGTSSAVLKLGMGRLDAGHSYIDLIGDTTYSEYGMRLIRGKTGPDSYSKVQHRGLGPLNVETVEQAPLNFLTGSVQRMSISAEGKVGIGTDEPNAPLEVVATPETVGSGNAVVVLKNAGALAFQLNDTAADPDTFWNFSNAVDETEFRISKSGTGQVEFTVDSSGNVLIPGNFVSSGTTLTVPDYVFAPNYDLMPLDELASFVGREGHLPNIPNAEEVKNTGLNLTEMQMRLLEKVEELTLYTIAQQDRIEDLSQENDLLRDRLDAMEELLQKNQ